MDKSFVSQLFHQPLMQLVSDAHELTKKNFPPHYMQLNSLISIKTGACPEDCAYCPQSARYQKETKLKIEPLMKVDEVVQLAQDAKNEGAHRVCLGASYREVKNNSDFDRILTMVKKVKDLDMEVCCTLGMISEEQAMKLKEAGLTAYNHNLDTSEEYYPSIITTRTYQERLDTIKHVQNVGLEVCCGGIIGLGESDDDRINLLLTLATMNPQPQSVPINVLVPVKGTPLADNKPIDELDIVRMVACARLLMPKTKVRLSAGRLEMSTSTQLLCTLAGANSIFIGDKLLTTPNPSMNKDSLLLKEIGYGSSPITQ
jgi:biotin synthase